MFKANIPLNPYQSQSMEHNTIM